jgi:ABC-type multidrug transport system ATPase subunit
MSDGKGLNNFSLTIETGEVFGFLGSNGSGKSTILKLLNGMIKPMKGQIEVHCSPIRMC